MRWPSVSCICITRNRRLFVRQALWYFMRAKENYPGLCQLLILDGSPEPHPVGRYAHRHGQDYVDWVSYYPKPETSLQVGKARNELCEMSNADIIIHWDDDDWQHPWRIGRQVAVLMSSPGDALTCTSRYYGYHIQQRQAVKAKSWLGEGGSMGATFAYWRDTWKKTPFRDVETGDDIFFQGDLRDRGCPLLDAKDPELVVYIRHNQNHSALTNYAWNEEDTRDCRRLMGADVDFYDGLGELLPVANWAHPNAPGSKMHVMNPLQQQWAKHFK